MTELEQKLLAELELLEKQRTEEQEAVQAELKAIRLQLSSIVTLLSEESESGEGQSIEELLQKFSSNLLLGFQVLLENSSSTK